MEVDWSNDVALKGKEAPYDTLIPDSFWNDLGEKEKDLIRKTVETFQEKDNGGLYEYETQKHNLGRFQEYKKQHLEYGNVAEDKEIKLPKMKVAGKDLSAGKYVVAKKIGDQVVYLRIDDRENNKDDFTKDVIVYDSAKREWKFAEDSVLKEAKVNHFIFQKKYEPSYKNLVTKVNALDAKFKSTTPIPKAVLVKLANEIEANLKKHYHLKSKCRFREISSNSLKKHFDNQKIIINSLT